MGTVALRTSLIWHDEVMADLVHDRPTPITIGPSSEATLLTPELQLPAEFAVVRPGQRGYLLTLGDRMRGTISVGGVEHDVATFVRAADEPSAFRATPIGGSDWGVIELDESGDCKLFFQFVPLDEATWKGAGPLLDGESRASLAFSVMLHLALLLVTFRLADGSAPFVWPGPRALAGNYIVTRLDVEPPPEPTVTETEKPGARTPTIPSNKNPIVEPPPKRGAWTRPEKPTRKHVDSEDSDDGDDVDPETATQPTAAVGVMKFEDVLRGVRDRELANAIKKLGKMKNGKPCKPGKNCGPDGFGVGPAGGPRGHEEAGKDGTLGKHEGTGDLDTGGNRDSVCVGSGCGGGGGTPISLTLPLEPPTGPTLTKDDIDRVMKRNKGLFRQCYQRALDRSGLGGGDLVVRFAINGDGKVTSSRSSGGSLAGTDVSSCVTSKITLLKFPALGGAIVNYPFVFSSGH